MFTATGIVLGGVTAYVSAGAVVGGVGGTVASYLHWGFGFPGVGAGVVISGTFLWGGYDLAAVCMGAEPAFTDPDDSP
jgi:hypothetical protein